LKICQTLGKLWPGGSAFGKVDKQYQLIAAIKTKSKDGGNPVEPLKNHVEFYTVDEWNAIADEMRAAEQNAKGKYSEMEASVREAKEFGHSDDVGVKPVYSAAELVGGNQVVTKGFTADHAGAIYDAVAGIDAAAGEAWDMAFSEAVSRKRPMAALKAALQSIAKATGSVSDRTFASLRTLIYDTHRSTDGSKQAFARSLLQGIGTQANAEARVEGADTGRAVQEPGGVGSNTGGGKPGGAGSGSSQGAKAGTGTGKEGKGKSQQAGIGQRLVDAIRENTAEEATAEEIVRQAIEELPTAEQAHSHTERGVAKGREQLGEGLQNGVGFNY
jgi:hypothetical protein